MRDTLRHYRVTDAPSFRLVLNAVHALLRDDGSHRLAATGDASSIGERADAVLDIAPVEMCRHALAALPDFGTGEEADLFRDITAGIAARLERVTPRLSAVIAEPHRPGRLTPSWQHLSMTMARHSLAADAPLAQRLMEADLGVSLIECWTRAAEMDRALSQAKVAA
jgi:hypothetical protein